MRLKLGWILDQKLSVSPLFKPMKQTQGVVLVLPSCLWERRIHFEHFGDELHGRPIKPSRTASPLASTIFCQHAEQGFDQRMRP